MGTGGVALPTESFQTTVMRYVRTTVYLLLAPMFALSHLSAQSPGTRVRPLPACYRITIGQWTPELGVNAAFHAVPSKVRLDTLPAARGGWIVTPDIEYPISRRMQGLPRWTLSSDTVVITWSTGFQSTTLRLRHVTSTKLRGAAVVWSDANEFGSNPPHADVTARQIQCENAIHR